MKGLLLALQSVAASALRAGRVGGGGGAVRLAGGERAVRLACTNSRTGAGRAAFLAAAAAGAGAGLSSTAMCSNGEGEANLQSAAAGHQIPASQIPSTLPQRKSIDEPDETPEHNPLLPFPESALRHDTYSGVTLDLTTLAASLDTDEFGHMLHKALEIWTAEHRRGIWLKLSTAQSHLIASATSQGFDFQHAEPGYCVLTKWLPKETLSRLPNGPTHQVGIGALVIHPLTGKMLAVQERTGPAAKRKLWKMPTGLTDPGEDIAVAAVRELKEETGLDCVFDKIICFRQAHGGLFGRSDMFFVCLCRLAPEAEERVRNGGEVELLPQEEEILQADWIDMEDYATQGVRRESPLYRTMNGAMLKAAKKGISYSSLNGDEGGDGDDGSHGFVAKNLPVGFRPGSNTIYVSSKL
ncbi:hypothetical protein ACHAXT_001528 [Thalassiosira profunda]